MPLVLGDIIGLKASANAPIKYGEKASPNMWETKIWVAEAIPGEKYVKHKIKFCKLHSPLLVGITMYRVISETIDQLAFRRRPEQ